MNEVLVTLTEFFVPLIDLVALVAIVAGTLECVVGVIRTTVVRAAGHERRAVWLAYARWLVAGLTFQLGADILETAVAPSWDDIGRLAAIAVIRTFLDYFLGRDVDEVREREAAGEPRKPEPA
jgi:uncharacterized membrane protein